ncbi:MAG: FAD-dependent oxidoreductase [Clostridia bacterium]
MNNIKSIKNVELKCDFIKTKYDVIVIGGGTAGTFAAMAAAREGKKTLLCEREYCLGGTSTLSLTTPRMTNHMTENPCNSSLAAELQSQLEIDGFGYDNQWFNPIMQGFYLEKMCRKYGVELLYGACFIGVIKENRSLKSVLFQTASGLSAYSADCFVDATGNAAVAYESGCPTESGDVNGDNQPMTLRFAVSGVDIAAAKEFCLKIGVWADLNLPIFEIASKWNDQKNPLTLLFEKAVADGTLQKRDGNYFQAFYCKYCGEGIVWCNCPEAGHIRDANSSKSITEMVTYSREAAIRLCNFFKKYLGGFENCSIHSFATIPGIRESRRAVGEYYLTEDDFLLCKKAPDCVAQTAYPIDVHDETNLRLQKIPHGEYYEISYKCMIPKNADNLLVAGRCISASFVAQSSMRIQPVCMALGEAAGIAAATNPNVREVDGTQIRKRMELFGGKFV